MSSKKGLTVAPVGLSPEDLSKVKDWCERKYPHLVPQLEDIVEECLDYWASTGEQKTFWDRVVRVQFRFVDKRLSDTERTALLRSVHKTGQINISREEAYHLSLKDTDTPVMYIPEEGLDWSALKDEGVTVIGGSVRGQDVIVTETRSNRAGLALKP